MKKNAETMKEVASYFAANTVAVTIADVKIQHQQMHPVRIAHTMMLKMCVTSIFMKKS